MPTILVVDDEPSIIELAKLYLEQEGYCVEAAASGQEALTRQNAVPPDLIVLDLELDEPSPEQTCAQFAQQSSEARTSLVLLASRRRLADVSVGEFVVKPYHYGPLIRRIEEMLGAAGRMPARCA